MGLWKGSSVFQRVVLLMLLSGLLPHVGCKESFVRHSRGNHPIQCRVSDPFLVPHEFYQPGDIIIGKISSQAFALRLETNFSKQLSEVLINTVPKNYQHILALVYAVKEVNENLTLLPNVTLGFHIYDSFYNGQMTYKATLDLLCMGHKLITKHKCDVRNNLIAIIGGLDTWISLSIAIVTNIFKIPQLTYGSLVSWMTDRMLFPSIYQMVPNESNQYIGVACLLQHFGWTWVGIFTMDYANAERFLQDLVSVLSQRGICHSFIEKMPRWTYFERMSELLSKNLAAFSKHMNSDVNVFVVHGQPPSMYYVSCFFRMAGLQSPIGKVWIWTTHWEFESGADQKDWAMQPFQGSMSLAVHANEPLGFQRFLQKVNPSWAEEDGFINDFWEQAFDCLLKNSSVDGKNTMELCTGHEKLKDLPGLFFQMGMTGHSYSVYNAAHTTAHALQTMYESRSKYRTFMPARQLQPWNLQPWQLHSFLRHTAFNNSAGDTIRFDENGELIAGFDIAKWFIFPNKSLVKEKVGRLDPRALPGKELTLEDEMIYRNTGFNQVFPVSVCNDHCYPGSSRQPKEGLPFCCYDCTQCPEGMISAKKDMDYCISCPLDHYPSAHHNHCIPKVISYLSYEDSLGMSLALTAVSFSVGTVLVLGTFMKHKGTPIVKANNQSLTYIILISLLLCFLCSLLFIGKPQKVTCLVRQMAFGIIFSVALSALLAKTITVVIAFMATTQGSRIRKWVSKKMANFIILFGCFIQGSICTLWISISPPFPDVNTYSVAEEIVLECNEGSEIMFYCVLGYMDFLAIICFTVAFFARKLPDNFNEAKFISFSMLVFCSVWVSFVPAYLSIKGKCVVAVEIFSILASSAAMLGFLFLPKCYLIVIKPELNSRKQIRVSGKTLKHLQI